MGNEWNPDFESRVHQLFSTALSTDSDATVLDCVEQLRHLGLDERQIQNGLIAGAIQLAIEQGAQEVPKAILSMMTQEDARIVMESIKFKK